MSERETLRAVMANVMQTVGYGGAVYEEKAERLLTALEAAGVRLVPAKLDSANMDHWKIASAGITAIEDFGGQFGSDHTPERQIADAYRDMVQIAASPYAPEATTSPEPSE